MEKDFDSQFGCEKVGYKFIHERVVSIWKLSPSKVLYNLIFIFLCSLAIFYFLLFLYTSFQISIMTIVFNIC